MTSCVACVSIIKSKPNCISHNRIQVSNKNSARGGDEKSDTVINIRISGKSYMFISNFRWPKKIKKRNDEQRPFRGGQETYAALSFLILYTNMNSMALGIYSI